MNMNEAICVIPARGGSKRIPRKNIKVFHGEPMISRAISLAKSCGLFQRVIVSTDDAEIATISEHCGAEVPFIRPPEISDDTASTVSVISHAAKYLAIPEEISVCCLYPNTPLINSKHLLEGLRILNEIESIKYVAAVQRFSYPIQRRLLQNSSNIFNMEEESNLIKPTQSFENYWHDAGQFYWGRSSSWKMNYPILVNTGGVELKPWEAWDIDTEEDR
jgi:N-acylneuraminate cytidylyltransferase